MASLAEVVILRSDPSGFPDSPWREHFGDYCNRELGQPYFVSLLLYLNAGWPRDWDAETLLLDGQTDMGLVVRPCRSACCRCVLTRACLAHMQAVSYYKMCSMRLEWSLERAVLA